MNATSIEFKGGGFTLSVLALSGSDLPSLQAQLNQHILRAPKLFAQMPVVLDLAQLGAAIQVDEIVTIARQCGLAPIAINGAAEHHLAQAKGLGLAKFSHSRSVANQCNQQVHTRIIDRPIRSGQQIYAEGTDLLVTSSVGAGAEIVADGNIVVLGPMRGRAFAGASGRDDARIICHKQHAELLSIAGHYQLADQIPESMTGVASMHSLEQARLIHKPLAAF